MNFTALHQLKHHEGVRKKPYLDSVLLWTTGVGHLIAPPEHLKMTLEQRKEAKLKAEKLKAEALAEERKKNEKSKSLASRW